MDRNETKRFIRNFVELEKERATLQEQIVLLEKKVKAKTTILENAEESKNSIEKSALNKFLLGMIGKKEERLEQEEIRVQRARSDLNSALYECDSAKERMQSVITEINGLEDMLQEVLNFLKKDDDVIKESIIAIKELFNMRYFITEDIAKLKNLFKRAEEIWWYGDIHVDFSGRRYDRKDITLKEHTTLIEREISNLIKHIKIYNTYAPDEIRIDYHEDWMDDKAYWDGQQIAADSHGRIKKVDEWFSRFNSMWNELKSKQDEVEEIMRKKLNSILL